MKISAVILTHKPGNYLLETLDVLSSESGIEVIILNSSGDLKELENINKYKFKTIMIPQGEFNHGKTRNIGWRAATGDIVIFLTQDSVLIEGAIGNITKIFNDSSVGVATGRQLPHKDASPFAAHARLFNYPAVSNERVLNDKEKYGVKTFFNSNSFSAYKRKVLEEIGGFPEDIIASEDNYFTAKALMKGYKAVYAAEACVYHSHNYGPFEEFRRYFDIGVFHSRESWLIEIFGRAEGEGGKFVKSEFKYLLKNGCWYRIPEAVFRNALKYIGYRLGKMEKKIPLKIKRILSMQKEYWKN